MDALSHKHCRVTKSCSQCFYRYNSITHCIGDSCYISIINIDMYTRGPSRGKLFFRTALQSCSDVASYVQRCNITHFNKLLPTNTFAFWVVNILMLTFSPPFSNCKWPYFHVQKYKDVGALYFTFHAVRVSTDLEDFCTMEENKFLTL